MPTATLTSKGQITLPAEVRRALGLSRGQRVEFTQVEGGFLVTAPARPVSRLAGFFGPHQGPPVGIEQMNRDIAQAAAGAL
ncbi:MAG: AbrB/MazE/SpoVT family DNA-binding domain-containing protein [Bifidobacteriaceae bacterium]|nr:AbrB/MazE/SpoVT family DNA-binding domain-containing protein [Bifidobacteriaceae bacterium]